MQSISVLTHLLFPIWQVLFRLQFHWLAQQFSNFGQGHPSSLRLHILGTTNKAHLALLRRPEYLQHPTDLWARLARGIWGRESAGWPCRWEECRQISLKLSWGQPPHMAAMFYNQYLAETTWGFKKIKCWALIYQYWLRFKLLTPHIKCIY